MKKVMKLLPKYLKAGLLGKIVRSTIKDIPNKIDYRDNKSLSSLKRFFASEKIHGNEYGFKSDRILNGLPNNVKQDLLLNTIERNIRAMHNNGYSDNEIELYKLHVNQLLSSVKVGLYSGADYSAANVDFDGFYDNDKFFISVNKDAKNFSPSFILKHEGRHMLDYRSDMTDDLHKYLRDAYDDDFLNLPNLEDAGILKGYKFMDRERVTTNRDARDKLLGYINIPSSVDKYNKHKISKGISDMIDGLNASIDGASDSEVFDAVHDANGYGRRYIDYLRKNNKLTHDKANLFRSAMKYVGSYALPVFGGASWMLYNNKNNNIK